MDIDSLLMEEEEDSFELPGPGIGCEIKSSDLLKQYLSYSEARDHNREPEREEVDEGTPQIRGGADVLMFTTSSAQSESDGVEDEAAVEAQLSGAPYQEVSSSRKRNKEKESEDWKLTASDEPIPPQGGSSFQTLIEEGKRTSSTITEDLPEREASQAHPSTQRNTALPSPPRSSEPRQLHSSRTSPENMASSPKKSQETRRKEQEVASPTILPATQAARRPAPRASKPAPKRMQQFAMSSQDNSDSDANGSGSGSETEEEIEVKAPRVKQSKRAPSNVEASESRKNSTPASTSAVINPETIPVKTSHPVKSSNSFSEVKKATTSTSTSSTRAMPASFSKKEACSEDQNLSSGNVSASRITSKSEHIPNEENKTIKAAASSSKSKIEPSTKAFRTKATAAQIEAQIPQADLDKL